MQVQDDDSRPTALAARWRERANETLFFEHTLNRWRDTGLIREHRILVNQEHYLLRLEVTIAHHTHLRYEMHRDELVMMGAGALMDWLLHVQADIEHHWRRLGLRQGEFRRSREDAFYRARVQAYDRLVDPPLIFDEARIFLEGSWNALCQESAESTKANDKAKELFGRVAGAAALATLEAQKPLRIKGSRGGRYDLHRRSTYCVTRVADGAKMCAVVPGVPLYDHLLGVKLVIETDEPRFIETANVSNGPMPGGITWVQPEDERRHTMLRVSVPLVVTNNRFL